MVILPKNNDPLLMGIDLGTSSLKTILITPNGRIIAEAAQNYPIHMLHQGWAEQNPADWVQAAVLTIRQVLYTAEGAAARVKGISFSGQMHGLVSINADHLPLRPAIIWADQRSTKQIELIYANLSIDKLAELTANPVSTGFMLPSWLWMLEHEPQLAAQTAALLLPKDYLRMVMCGEIGSEPSDASSTLLFDPIHVGWQLQILDQFQINPSLLPRLYSSTDQTGAVLPSFAEQCGLLPGTPVFFGAGDQAAQALANGIVAPGQFSCTIGTGGQLFAPVNPPRFDPQLRMHLFCHALPRCWHLEAATLSAGLSLRWLKENILQNQMSYQQLADDAMGIEPGAEGCLFLPNLAGSRTPYMDAAANGMFMGLTLKHQIPHLARSVMEGVVMELRQGLELMLSLGARADQILASGGGTRHPLWLQLQADIFNRPVYRSQTREAAAVGAAMLAGIGAGIYPNAQQAIEAVVHLEETVIQPNAARVQQYDAIYQQFKRLYPAQKEFYT